MAEERMIGEVSKLENQEYYWREVQKKGDIYPR